MKKSDLLKSSIDCCLDSGITMKAADGSTTIHAPFTLRPTSFPLKKYEEAMRLQPIFHKLVHKMVNQREFLLKIVEKYMLTIQHLFLFLAYRNMMIS